MQRCLAVSVTGEDISASFDENLGHLAQNQVVWLLDSQMHRGTLTRLVIHCQLQLS